MKKKLCPECGGDGLSRRGACLRCFAGVSRQNLLDYIGGELLNLMTPARKGHCSDVVRKLQDAIYAVRAALAAKE